MVHAMTLRTTLPRVAGMVAIAASARAKRSQVKDLTSVVLADSNVWIPKRLRT